jgi:hypothetical protein
LDELQKRTRSGWARSSDAPPRRIARVPPDDEAPTADSPATDDQPASGVDEPARPAVPSPAADVVVAGERNPAQGGPSQRVASEPRELVKIVVYIDLEQDEWLTAQEFAARTGRGRRRGRKSRSQIISELISAAMAQASN